jgi:hypothetical protein
LSFSSRNDNNNNANKKGKETGAHYCTQIHPQFSCEEGIEKNTPKKKRKDHRFHPDHNKRIEIGISAENFFKNKMRSDPRRGRGIHAPKDQTEEEDEADAAITILGNDQLRLHSVCRSGLEWRPLEAGNVHWDYWCKMKLLHRIWFPWEVRKPRLMTLVR